jgi:hypothetical protein
MWTGVRGAVASLAMLTCERRLSAPAPEPAPALPEACPSAIWDRWALAPERAALVLSLWGEAGHCRISAHSALAPAEPMVHAPLYRPALPTGVAALQAKLTAAGYVFDQKPAMAPRIRPAARVRAAA